MYRQKKNHFSNNLHDASIFFHVLYDFQKTFLYISMYLSMSKVCTKHMFSQMKFLSCPTDWRITADVEIHPSYRNLSIIRFSTHIACVTRPLLFKSKLMSNLCEWEIWLRQPSEEIWSLGFTQLYPWIFDLWLYWNPIGFYSIRLTKYVKHTISFVLHN